MPVTAVTGAQWGDEGKGRMVDYLATDADIVIRYQGGDNAGHTVINGFGKFALHLVPSGIFNPKTTCLIGAGTVVHPPALLAELEALEAAGCDTSRLVVEARAHLVLPWHRRLDALQEAARGAGEIGTTRRGIGPAYADKAARTGLRVGDLLDRDHLAARLDAVIAGKNAQLAAFGDPPVDRDQLYSELCRWSERLGPRIIDSLPLLREAVARDQHILLEGQLGIMRDLDWGTWPFVTSSNPMAQLLGAGLPARSLQHVIGIAKVYTTAVGAGPFPTELHDDTGDALRRIGHEYGATTGRPRRTGWYDAVAVGHAVWLNGYTSLALTKLDVLDTFDELRICTAYRVDGKLLHHIPDTPVLARCEPVYETHPGWHCTTSEVRRWEDLPAAARAFVRRIEALAGVPVGFVSVGPERDQLIVMPPTPGT